MYYLKEKKVEFEIITWVVLKWFTFLNEAMFLHEIPSVKGAVIQNCSQSFVRNVLTFLLGEMPEYWCAICGI